jgi:hypothetical protein
MYVMFEAGTPSLMREGAEGRSGRGTGSDVSAAKRPPSPPDDDL